MLETPARGLILPFESVRVRISCEGEGVRVSGFCCLYLSGTKLLADGGASGVIEIELISSGGGFIPGIA